MTEALASEDDPLQFAADYARGLLEDVGAAGRAGTPNLAPCHPDLEWAASGAMALTGHHDGPPLLAPAPLASAARAAVAALSAVAQAMRLPAYQRLSEIDGGKLLGERAALSGFSRRGRTSPGGSCHLLACRDGWIAVNLARSDDVALLPAWLGEGDRTDVLAFLRSRVCARGAFELVRAGRELGLPVAEAAQPPAIAPPWHRVAFRYAPSGTSRATRPLVLDLSGLWAGPLATHLLALAGARVIKVESTRRPDGARRGPQAFYDVLNSGKESVAIDFTAQEGRRTLACLLEHADIVFEASRPRALAQIGIEAESFVRRCRGMVWVSITGYGREEPYANWVAFGDDAGVAAGLAMGMCPPPPTAEDGPVFCGDAIADPLTGIHAAFGALAAWNAGGGVLLDVNLRDVTAHVLGRRTHLSGESRPVARVRARKTAERMEWDVITLVGSQTVLAPRARAASQQAAELGAHTRRVLKELSIAC